MKKQIEGHKYDDIKTAKELVKEVALNGMSLNESDQCRAQDIIGHSTFGELEELANSKEEIKNQSLGSYFYFLLKHIWNIEDVIRFWNNNSNPEHKEVEILRDEAKKFREYSQKLKDEVESLKSELAQLKAKAANDNASSEKDKQEILRLKARLFDLMEELESKGAA